MLNCSGLTSGRGSAWLERLVRDQEVGGSNPLAPIGTARFGTLSATGCVVLILVVPLTLDVFNAIPQICYLSYRRSFSRTRLNLLYH